MLHIANYALNLLHAFGCGIEHVSQNGIVGKTRITATIRATIEGHPMVVNLFPTDTPLAVQRRVSLSLESALYPKRIGLKVVPMSDHEHRRPAIAERTKRRA